MKYSMYINTSARKLPKETTEIHLSRPLKLKLLLQVLRKCKGLKTITLNKSAFDRLSKPVRALLFKKKIEVMIAKTKGRPIQIDLEKLLEVIELRRDYRSFREIEEMTNVPKSTAHYIIKHSSRKKVKFKDLIIHLEQ